MPRCCCRVWFFPEQHRQLFENVFFSFRSEELIMVSEQCAVCSRAASQRCAGCHVAYYCSRDHQKDDWKNHKRMCKPFKICEDDAMGRYLVATRDIKSGEVLLREAPLLAGPPQTTAPVCLGCYQVLAENYHIVCPKGCGWPLCSMKCAESPAHKPECDVTRNIRGEKVTIRNFGLVHPTYQCVTALRMLWTRSSNPELWKKLSALECHTDKRRGTHKWASERVAVADFLKRFFKMEVPEEDVLKTCGVIQVNAHEVPVSEPAHVAIYDVTSMLEHDCVPNCAKSFTSSGHVIIRAARAIPRDQHLSISYTDTLWGTANRRHHLAETKYFWCRCQRCSDPTELGTFFSGIKCTQSGCSEYLLPVNPLFEEDSETNLSDWRCCGCDVIVPGVEMASVIEKVGQRLGEMEKGKTEAAEKFLLEFSGKVLHPNHFYLTDVRLALAQLIGQETQRLPSLTDQQLQRKMALLRQVLLLASTLFLGEVRVRGMLIFELHAVVAEEGRRKANSGEIGPGELRDRLLESKRFLEDAIFLLNNEPEILPEGKIVIQARHNLKELDVLLQTIHAKLGDSPL